MKYSKKILLIIVILANIFMIFIPNINANGIPPTPAKISIFYFIICIFVYFNTIFLEYGFGFLILRNVKSIKKQFLKLIFYVNTFTFPLTQLAVYYFYLVTTPGYLQLMILAIESCVIVSEWLLITIYFNRYRVKPDLGLNYSKSRIFSYSLAANIASYLLGFIFFIPNLAYFFALIAQNTFGI